MLWRTLIIMQWTYYNMLMICVRDIILICYLVCYNFTMLWCIMMCCYFWYCFGVNDKMMWWCGLLAADLTSKSQQNSTYNNHHMCLTSQKLKFIITNILAKLSIYLQLLIIFYLIITKLITPILMLYKVNLLVKYQNSRLSKNVDRRNQVTKLT